MSWHRPIFPGRRQPSIFGTDELNYRVRNGNCLLYTSLPPMRRRMKLLLPFDKAGLAALIRRDGVVEYEEYTPDGLLLVAMADIRIYHEIKDYLTE